MIFFPLVPQTIPGICSYGPDRLSHRSRNAFPADIPLFLDKSWLITVSCNLQLLQGFLQAVCCDNRTGEFSCWSGLSHPKCHRHPSAGAMLIVDICNGFSELWLCVMDFLSCAGFGEWDSEYQDADRALLFITQAMPEMREELKADCWERTPFCWGPGARETPKWG